MNSRKNEKENLILFWNQWFSDSSFGYGVGKYDPFIKNRCPVTNCETTADKSRLMESDLIIFHMRDPIPDLPPKRKSNQRWVFMLYESPLHSPTYEKYNNLFNLTATYRHDSDFETYYFSHAFFEWAVNNEFNENQDFHASKSNFSAIIVSNCHVGSRRLEYLKKLQESISVTIYGLCGVPCPENCQETIGLKYKFYLAFENSICEDYVTEKLFGMLRYNIIPVVYGAGPYDRHIPKSGYIDLNDFETPKALSDYLIYLDNNKTAYNSYFKWKKYLKYNPYLPKIGNICELCIRLNIDREFGIKQSIKSDLGNFWKKGHCYDVDTGTFKRHQFA